MININFGFLFPVIVLRLSSRGNIKSMVTSFSFHQGLLGSLVEQGPVLKDEDYVNAIALLCRSEIPFDKNALEVRERKLREIISEHQKKKL